MLLTHIAPQESASEVQAVRLAQPLSVALTTGQKQMLLKSRLMWMMQFWEVLGNECKFQDGGYC
jgi:hypothetical protein